MPPPKLGKLELKVMEAFWDHGPSSIRQILDRISSKKRPAYTTVQTTIGRLEAKAAIEKIKKIGGAYIYRARVSREEGKRRLIDIPYDD